MAENNPAPAAKPSTDVGSPYFLQSSDQPNQSLVNMVSDVFEKLGRLSIESAKQGENGLDDLLSSTDGGKHDYDWLLTPPGTPLVPSLDGNEPKSTPVAPRSSPSIRSISAIKASRLSASSHAGRPTRSSSATRPSVSSSQYSINSNKSNSILNTSSASLSSYIRSSTPTSRSSSITRSSTPSVRPKPKVSMSSTPCKVHPAPDMHFIEEPRPSHNSRPSTPISRPKISANLNSIGSRSISRPTTPTRRNPGPSISPVKGTSASEGRTLARQNLASVSCPSSPGLRVRPQPQLIVPPDFPLETPPNLRRTLPDRPPSAGRSRPGVSLTLRGNLQTTSSTALPRRRSSPMVVRERITESIGRGRIHANGQLSDTTDSGRELSTRKPVKTSTESTGFSLTISKKSLDVAIKNMDRKNGANITRPLAGSNLFPQSIRSTNRKSQRAQSSSTAASVNGSLPFGKHCAIAENRNLINRSSESGDEDDKYSAKLSNVDINESSRYDMMLIEEDLNWLHSMEDKFNQEPIFDNGLEPLPEPFSPL